MIISCKSCKRQKPRGFVAGSQQLEYESSGLLGVVIGHRSKGEVRFCMQSNLLISVRGVKGG